MRIVQVNKFVYRRDGAAVYMLELSDRLRAAGHEVAFFGMQQQQTIDTPWKKYFVDEINFDRSEGIFRNIRKVAHMIWSTEARRKFSKLLDEFNPDIVHLHVMYHQISPSILPECRRRKIPMVMTSHDYHLISPNYSLFTHGRPCVSCLGNSFWRTVTHNCLDSMSKTLAGALEHLVHQTLRVYEKNLSRVICPSAFMQHILARFGWPIEKLIHLPNPVFMPSDASAPTLGSAVVYAGRLAREKGIFVLLEAARKLPDIPFLIAGDGPERRALLLAAPKNVQYLGFKNITELRKIIIDARLVLVPSVWYENFPYAALEPMAAGKAVIGARIGGIPEIIRDGETGFLTPPGDARELVDKIKKIYHDTDLLARVGESAAAYVRRAYDPEEHVMQIVQVYEEAIQQSSSRTK